MIDHWTFWPFFGIFLWLIWWPFFGIFMRRMHWKDHGYGARTPEKSPLDILKERYAKGEITKKEFKEMKKDLA